MFRILLILALILIFSSKAFAEKEIKLNNGDIYIGQILKETEAEIQLHSHDGISMTLSKSKINSISDANEKIITQKDKIFIGKVTEESEDLIKMTTYDGISIEIPQNQVKIREFISSDDIKNYKQPAYYKRSNPNHPGISNSNKSEKFDNQYLGFSLLDPGGLNLVYAYTTNSDLGFRMQGGYLTNIYGVMGTLLINIEKSHNLDMNFGICVGYTAIKENTYQYTNRVRSYTFGGVTSDIIYHGVFFEAGVTYGKESYISKGENKFYLLLQLGYLFKL